MLKVTLALGVVLVLFVVDSSCQDIILPTYRPQYNQPEYILPTYRPSLRGPQIRLAREVGLGDLSLPKEDLAILSPITTYSDRTVRSLDSPSAKRGGGSPRTSSGSRNTGPTHPGYNRRNTREIRLPRHLNTHRPKPLYPSPTLPAPVPRNPILARTARDIQIPGVKKPTYRDVIIPNWNPNVKTKPWNRIGGKHRRSLDFTDAELELIPHEREARDISGLPQLKKPTYRDVVIPNWNPHVRTDPLKRLKGRQH